MSGPVPQRLRLVSWNVHGVPGAPRTEERLAAIADLLRARAPDLVLLQEVWRPRDAEALARALAPAGYAPVEVPGGRRWPLRSAGLLGFLRSRAGWRASEPRFHEFRAEAADWKLWEGDGFGDKGVLDFRLARDGLAVAVVNTHLQAAYAPGGYAEVRRRQLAELREVVRRAERAAGGAALPVLVAGDLNTAPDEPAFAELLGLRDLGAELREACGCGTSVRAGPSPWIDHLLASVPAGFEIEAELELIRSVAPDLPYSDHHGLDALLRIAPSAPRASLAALAAARLAAPTTRREFLAAAAALALPELSLDSA
jgi:endonuclease/exonuclease/phosphatase family metal-dependent hydrolase